VSPGGPLREAKRWSAQSLCGGQGKREGPGTPHRSSARSISDPRLGLKGARKGSGGKASWSSRIPGWAIANRTEDCADHLSGLAPPMNSKGHERSGGKASWSSRIPGWAIGNRTEDCADHLSGLAPPMNSKGHERSGGKASWSSRIPGWAIASRTEDCADHFFTVSYHPGNSLGHRPAASTQHHSNVCPVGAFRKMPGRLRHFVKFSRGILSRGVA
jgi:hypothetical protein